MFAEGDCDYFREDTNVLFWCLTNFALSIFFRVALESALMEVQQGFHKLFYGAYLFVKYVIGRYVCPCFIL